MAIQNLEKQLQLVLSRNREKAERKFQYKYLTHKIIVDRDFISKDLIRILKPVKTKREGALTEAGIKTAVTKYFTVGIARKQAQTQKYRVYKNYAEAYNKRLSEWSNSAKYDSSDIVSITGDSKKLVFTFFGSYLKGAQFTGQAAGRRVLTNLFRGVMGHLRKEFKLTKTQDATAKKESERSSFFGLHGIIDEGIQTTIATTSVAKKLSELADSEVPGMGEAVNRFAERLFIDYNLGKNTLVDLTKFSEDFVVNMEIGHYKWNSNKKITMADRPAISEWVKMVSDELLETIADPDTKGSTPRGKLVYRLAAENAESKINKAVLAAGGKLLIDKEVKEKKGRENKKTSTKTVSGRSKSRAVSKKKGRRSKVAPVIATTGQAKTGESAISLRTLLDARLNETVRKNMVSPALVNRTGRFADSVKTTDVIIGPRGGITINYTYDRERYGTFEPGGRQGSTNRDPRSLIKRSIRELAMELIGSRFMNIRRV